MQGVFQCLPEFTSVLRLLSVSTGTYHVCLQCFKYFWCASTWDTSLGCPCSSALPQSQYSSVVPSAAVLEKGGILLHVLLPITSVLASGFFLWCLCSCGSGVGTPVVCRPAGTPVGTSFSVVGVENEYVPPSIACGPGLSSLHVSFMRQAHQVAILDWSRHMQLLGAWSRCISPLDIYCKVLEVCPSPDRKW